MAERRMFSKTIIDSDAFLDMPATAQLLYFHLSMRADDDGFVNKPKSVMRMICSKDDDLKLLFAKKFLIPFESGVVVIKHWRIHNYIAKDRYTETKYKEEKATLLLDENNAYTQAVDSLYTACIQNDDKTMTQVRLGKDRLGKDSIESVADKPPAPTRKTSKSYGEFGWVKLTDEEYHRLLNDLGEAEVKRCIAYVDESAQSNGNKNKWRDWNLVVKKCHKQGWGLSQGRQPKGNSHPASPMPDYGGEGNWSL